MKIFLIVMMGVFLKSCGDDSPATVEGACKVFTDPGFAVRGKRPIDSRWIGATQEKGIDVCGWKRPQK